jgi:hypothetical protein
VLDHPTNHACPPWRQSPTTSHRLCTRYSVPTENRLTQVPSTKGQSLIDTQSILRVSGFVCSNSDRKEGAVETTPVARSFTNQESPVTNHQISNRPIQKLESTPTHRKQTLRPASNRPIFRVFFSEPQLGKENYRAQGLHSSAPQSSHDLCYRSGFQNRPIIIETNRNRS